MSRNVPAVSTRYDGDLKVNSGSGDSSGSPYFRLYAELLYGLDSPFAEFLKRLHGVSGCVKVGHPLGASSYWMMAEADATEALQMLAADNLYPRFKDNWARALTYRYRPLQEATPVNRVDNTLKEVIQQAEEWIDVLFDAMCNVVNVNNKPNSIELNMFKSPTLDKKSVEAACRSILIALVHRCVIGYCGLRASSSSYASREDKKLTCKNRLLAVIDALRHDKRICKDVLTEDSKVNFLVHAPLALMKCKKNQEKGNDVKRDLLAEAAAARRQGQASSIATLAGLGSGSSTPGLVSEDDISARKALILPPPRICQEILSSEGLVTLNEEHPSKKRRHSEMEDEDICIEGEISHMEAENNPMGAENHTMKDVKSTSAKTDPVTVEEEDDLLFVKANPVQKQD